MPARDGTVRTALVVGHFCPLPATHGNRRRLLSLFAWLRARGFRTVFVLQPTVVEDFSLIGELEKVVDHCIVARQASSVFSSLLARIPVLWRLNRIAKNDRDVDSVCWPTTAVAVKTAVRRYDPLVVISMYPFFSGVFKRLPGRTLKVIDTLEVFQRGAPERKQAGFPTEFSSASETRALNRADVVIGIQKNDAQALREIAPGKRVVTVVYPSPMMLPRSTVPEAGVILCVASDNQYNRYGLKMFLEHAWRSILDGYPNAVLHVIGSLTEDIMGPQERVVFKGIVTDSELARSYASAHVVINPQVSGTGLKIKSVEAISAGCAVVMNAAGADGIEQGSGTAFLLATDWKDFSRGVLRLLGDANLRLALERGASQFAKQRFSVEAAFQELAAVLDAHEARVAVS
jgi:hypothetical protein